MTRASRSRSRSRTPVVFRSWNTGANSGSDPYKVDALFPTLPGSSDGTECVAYAHVGQHGAADYFGVIARTRPARPEEYAPLLEELRSLGYHVQVYAREPRGAYRERRAAARSIRYHDPATMGGTC